MTRLVQPFLRGRWLALAVAAGAMLAAGGHARAAQETPAAAADPLRARLETRYDIVPLRDAIGLRPKSRDSRVRLIEIADGGIAVDGQAVSGRELRERVGADADLIIQLSYYDAAHRRAFLENAAERQPGQPPPDQRAPSSERPAERAPREPASRNDGRERAVGDRIRVFGDVSVARDEWVDGQVIAVFGSVRIDGRVSDQVVSVFGSIDLGPESRIDGDVVAVGGHVRRDAGARVNGRITDVDVFSRDRRFGAPWWGSTALFGAYGGTTRLFATLFRLFVLGLLGSIVVLVVRQPVERIGDHVGREPIKMAIVGLLAQLLFVPALILSVTILALSIIGIPLLVIVPFIIIAMLFILLGGFTGAAHLLGGWAAHRTGIDADQPYVRVWLGVLLILTPLLVARFFGIVGGPFHFLAFMIAALAILLEYLVWTTGFGAALTTAFESWRARRTPPAPAPGPTA
jgi:hypothetical protein